MNTNVFRKVLIVGAGFAGCVSARILADSGSTCVIIERRDHVGGNAFDYKDEHGILVHRYGPHIFHTNSKKVFSFLSRFTDWHFYEHQVLASVENKLYPIPINQNTINSLYGLDLNEEEVQKYLESVKVSLEVKTSEDVVLSSVGIDLCDKFFRGYTRKQWGLELRDLSPGVAARIPTRCNTDNRYFEDQYQFIPSPSYSKMFENMLDHKNIRLILGTKFDKKLFSDSGFDHLIFTGPIDEYYDFKFGRLPYRSLSFDFKYFANCDSFQPVAQINYPNDFEFTRVTEFKKITGQRHSGTTLAYEFPQASGEPFYPIPTPDNAKQFSKYQGEAKDETCVTFIGRLAQYKYFNMDQVVGSAIAKVQALIDDWNSST